MWFYIYDVKGQKKSWNIFSHLEFGHLIDILQFQRKRHNLGSKWRSFGISPLDKRSDSERPFGILSDRKHAVYCIIHRWTNINLFARKTAGKVHRLTFQLGVFVRLRAAKKCKKTAIFTDYTIANPDGRIPHSDFTRIWNNISCDTNVFCNSNVGTRSMIIVHAETY